MPCALVSLFLVASCSSIPEGVGATEVSEQDPDIIGKECISERGTTMFDLEPSGA